MNKTGTIRELFERTRRQRRHTTRTTNYNQQQGTAQQLATLQHCTNNTQPQKHSTYDPRDYSYPNKNSEKQSKPTNLNSEPTQNDSQHKLHHNNNAETKQKQLKRRRNWAHLVTTWQQQQLN